MIHSIIQRIKQSATEQNLTQVDLEQASGISQSYISSLFSGKDDNPTLATLERLSNATGLELVVVERGANSRTTFHVHHYQEIVIKVSPRAEECVIQLESVE